MEKQITKKKRAFKPIAVLFFPGTQCDEDVVKAFKGLNYPVQKIAYRDRFDPKKYLAFVIPGGFSYGDYLRAGALASQSPAMLDIHTAAMEGWPVLGICNGFQILCESQLLEGVLQLNKGLRFIDDWVDLTLQNTCNFWGGTGVKKSCRLPIAHKQGCYYISNEGKKKLEDQEQIWLKYSSHVNGSVGDIAGIMNPAKNVAGLMPHPERAMQNWMGGIDGALFFESVLNL